YGTASIGDIAIHPTNPDIVYVGTGEPNNRQTSSFGDGIYKTTDGGLTFTNIGLKDTQTIARIVIDVHSPETVYVASPGHLFGPNPERGIFKTTDGDHRPPHDRARPRVRAGAGAAARGRREKRRGGGKPLDQAVRQRPAAGHL